MSKKDDTIFIRINAEDKKKIKIRALQMGFKSVSEYVLYCCMQEVTTSEFINRNMENKGKYQ